MPSLDVSLAAPCAKVEKPSSDSYDAWQEWIEKSLLKNYIDCATRHDATVKAWPKQN